MARRRGRSRGATLPLVGPILLAAPIVAWLAFRPGDDEGQPPASRPELAEGASPAASTPMFDRLAAAVSNELLQRLPDGTFAPSERPSRPPLRRLDGAGSTPGPQAFKQVERLYIDIGRSVRLIDSITYEGAIDGIPVVVRMKGLVPISFQRVCFASSGARIACGIRARLSIAAYLTDRTLVCDELAHVDGVVEARCLSFDKDVRRWLVAEGFAVPVDPEDPYFRSQLASAQLQGAGIWADAQWKQEFLPSAREAREVR